MSDEHAHPSLDNIIDALQISSVSFSPSGSHVVYSTKPYGKKGELTVSALWIAETNKSKSARMLTSNSYNDNSPRWSPDGRYIAFISDRAGKDTCAIYVLDTQEFGSEAVAITDVKCRKAISGLQWNRSGTSIGYISADETFEADEKRKKDREDFVVLGDQLPFSRLRVVDVETRQTKVLFSKDVHVSAFGWSPDDKEVIIITCKEPGDDNPLKHGQDFERLSIDGGTTTHLTYFPSSINSSGPHPLIWLKEDQIWFVADYPAGEICSSNAVYKLTPSEKKWERLISGETGCASDISFDIVSNTIFAKFAEPERDVLLGMTGAAQGSHVRELREINTWHAVHTEKGAKFVYSCSDPTAPPEVFVQDESGKEIQLSAHAEDVFRKWSPSCQVHQLTCKTPPPSPQTDDDEKSFDLNGFLVSPTSASQATQALPTVVLVHGGPYYRQLLSFVAPHRPWMPALLATHKFNILVPNYRGNASQGKDFAQAIHGKAGTVDYDDILAMVDEGIAKGYIDKERIVMAGWSWGGMISYLSVSNNGQDSAGTDKSWRFKGSICGAGTCDGDMMAMLSDMYTHRKVLMGQLPWTSYIDDVTNRRGSAIWKLRKAVEEKRTAPVLILHGLADPRVVPQNAYAFKRACDYYGIPCEAVLYPREPHSFQERGSSVDMMKRVVAFCEKVLEV